MDTVICCTLGHDEVAEWLRRWTANPMDSVREGSNPFLVVVFLFFFYFRLFVCWLVYLAVQK